ncbi:hypothetical protein C488_19267 [Natrinema pellirubrum DSM 15624]|uniref:DUF7978 domain-containing protein n=1 Tax=Natrinema pellirubrum (strain DSM 15624 / CIP 106293 / JCM 10476 / NCIMB 786 / 157) TaxID=797303 RepID=L0JER7_NATP1|nr:hypothetical protein [Natrinema pellirubrum]AGB30040.1 hypothetical protein Natpe_0094 [Natrinema pellirubrum DSM 15624]ELY70185.1 hypothetical protein C488_19267 [Natrinema pellirubrum DSM 15624]
MSDGKQLDYEDESDVQRQVPQGSGNELPVKEGAVFGAIAVVATYLTHLLLTMIATAQSSPIAEAVGTGEDSLIITEMVPSWKAAGWSYLSVFGTGFEVDGEAAALGGAPNHAAAFGSGPGSPFFLSALFLFLVTVGGIVAAGYAVAKYTDADDTVDAAKAGVTVALPYVAFAAIAAFLMSHSYSEVPTVASLIGPESSGVLGLEASEYLNDAGDSVTTNAEFGPSTTDALLFAGIIVPAILGAVGGLLTQPRDALETVMAKVQ